VWQGRKGGVNMRGINNKNVEEEEDRELEIVIDIINDIDRKIARRLILVERPEYDEEILKLKRLRQDYYKKFVIIMVGKGLCPICRSKLVRRDGKGRRVSKNRVEFVCERCKRVYVFDREKEVVMWRSL